MKKSKQHLYKINAYDLLRSDSVEDNHATLSRLRHGFKSRSEHYAGVGQWRNRPPRKRECAG